MKVLLISPAAGLGGAERCLLDCVAALKGASRRVEVAVLSFERGPLLDKAGALGATVRVVEPPSELSQLGEGGLIRLASPLRLGAFAVRALPFLRELRRAIVSESADVVHTNGMKAHVLGGLLSPSSTRLVVHLHDFIGKRRASRELLPLIARWHRRTLYLANSYAVASDFASLAPGAKLRTIHNAVDTTYFRAGPAEPEWLAECADLPTPAPACVSFGLVATYARWKGHELFIRAAGRLRALHPTANLRFYVVGGPIYQTLGSQVRREDLERWATQANIRDCFGIAGFQDDIARVYRALNVVVHASTEPEPFGRTIVEAMACGRPVLVSQAGGAAELFQHSENALGFTPGSEAELAAAMARLLDAREGRRLGAAAERHAREHSAQLACPSSFWRPTARPEPCLSQRVTLGFPEEFLSVGLHTQWLASAVLMDAGKPSHGAVGDRI